MSLLMIFAGWQSFAGTTDSVFVLASNKVQFDAGTLATGDSARWFIQTGTNTWAEITGTTSGAQFAGTNHSILRIDGASFSQFTQPGDSLTATTQRIAVQIVSAGGCYSDDSSYFVAQVLPYLKSMTVNWSDSDALCANNSILDTLMATKPALTGAWAGSHAVSIGDITWWSEDASGSSPVFAQITSGTGGATIAANNTVTPGTSTLSFQTPLDTHQYLYHAQATYTLPSGYNLIVSNGSTANGHSTSRNVTIQATAAPTAPTINGSTSASGW